MREIKDLHAGEKIIIWQYHGLNVQDGHVATVLNRIVRKDEPPAVVVELDGIEGKVKITDKDYFDRISKKAEDSEDCDNVNHPKHYNQSKIETIEIMEALPATYNIQTAICLSNVIKYIFRAPFKNGKEDLKKAKWYLERALKNYEEGM